MRKVSRQLTRLRLTALGAALLMTGLSSASAEERRMERSITVSASGLVLAEPDLARLSSGVTTEADTAREALTRNTGAMKKVIEGLKGRGIEAKDIKTSNFRVEPRYNVVKSEGTPQIKGYRVSNQVYVAVRDLSKLGDILDDLVTLGANQMGGLHFEVSKADALKDTARTEAIANALRRAKLLAAAAGAEVGEVITISEEAMHVAPRGQMMARSSMAAEAVSIEAGTENLEARVTVTWALK